MVSCFIFHFHLDLYRPQVAILFVLYLNHTQTACCNLTILHALSRRMSVIYHGKTVCKCSFPLGINLKWVWKHSRDVQSWVRITWLWNEKPKPSLRPQQVWCLPLPNTHLRSNKMTLTMTNNSESYCCNFRAYWEGWTFAYMMINL